jgi:hypothetical protein
MDKWGKGNMVQPKEPPEFPMAEMAEREEGGDCRYIGMTHVGGATQEGEVVCAGAAQEGEVWAGTAQVGEACTGAAWVGALPWELPDCLLLHALEHWQQQSAYRALHIYQTALQLHKGYHQQHAYG